MTGLGRGAGSAPIPDRGVLGACGVVGLIPKARKEMKGGWRGRAGPSSTVGAGSGLTVGRRADACVVSDRARRVAAEAAALDTSNLLDSPRRVGASKMSRMLRSNDRDCEPSTGKVAAEVILRVEVGIVEEGREGRVGRKGRIEERAERNG